MTSLLRLLPKRGPHRLFVLTEQAFARYKEPPHASSAPIKQLVLPEAGSAQVPATQTENLTPQTKTKATSEPPPPETSAPEDVVHRAVKTPEEGNVGTDSTTAPEYANLPPAVRALPAAYRVRGEHLYWQLAQLPGLTARGPRAPLGRETPDDASIWLNGDKLPEALSLGRLLRILTVPYTNPGHLVPVQLLVLFHRHSLKPINHLVGRADSTQKRVIRPTWRRYLRL